MSAKHCTFNKVWLDPKICPEFVDWVGEVTGDPASAYCKVCCKLFKLSNMGKQAVVSHSKGPKHIKMLELKKRQPLISLFKNKPQCSDNTDSIPGKSSTTCTNEASIATIATPKSASDFTYHDDSVTSAETIWALQVVFNKISLNSCDRTTPAFKRMFPDSKIAFNYSMGKTKVAYVINHGIAPHIKTSLLSDLKDCQWFVVAFDESLNKVSQKCQMDLVIRFWNDNTDKVDTRYWNSVFLGRSTAEHLLNGFLEGLSDLDLGKLLQVSMDGPNVNKSFLTKLKNELGSDTYNNILLDIGVCGLHTVSGAVKTGHKKAGWPVYLVLRTMYHYFKDSPARRALYTTITGGTEFPLKFTSIRWLENGPCLDRALKVFDKVKEFVENEAVVTSENKKILMDTMKKPLLKAQLAGVRSIIEDCEPFLRRFQGSKPLAPFLHAALQDLIKNLMTKIIKPSKLESCNNVMDLDLSCNENLLASEKIHIGFEAKRLLKDAKCSEKDRLLYKREYKEFIVALIGKLVERSPLKSRLVRGLACFDPNVIKNHFAQAIQKADIVFETLHDCGKIKGHVADNARKQFMLLASATQSVWSQKFDDYKDDSVGLDEFYHSLIGDKNEYADIWYVMKVCFIISHGNASVEGGFSINKSLLVENLLEESLISQRLIYDSLKNVGGPENFQISQSLIKSVRTSRRRYQDKLKEKREMLSEEEKKKAEKRKINQQIREVEEKKKKIQLQREKENVELETLERALKTKKRQM